MPLPLLLQPHSGAAASLLSVGAACSPSCQASRLPASSIPPFPQPPQCTKQNATRPLRCPALLLLLLPQVVLMTPEEAGQQASSALNRLLEEEGLDSATAKALDRLRSE